MSIQRPVTRVGGLLVAASFLFAACSGGGASVAPSAAASAAPSEAGPSADPMADLVAAAQAEGKLTTIALPHDWCNYGEMIETFKAKYGLEVNELDPNAGSGDEIEAIKANKDNPGRPGAGRHRRRPGLRADRPRKRDSSRRTRSRPGTRSRTMPRTPTAAGTATTTACWRSRSTRPSSRTSPQDWSDLLKPEYKGQVALAGDPRTSNQAIQAVYAAALANGGSLDDAAPGLDFFKQLNDAGNFVPIIANAATVAAGETPITIRWTYNALSNRDATAASGGPAIEVVVPKSRPVRGRLRAGDQRLRAAPERRQAVDGVPLLRRGPDHLAEGLLPPDPLPRTWSLATWSRRTSWRSSRTSRAPSSRPSSSSTRPRRLITGHGTPWSARTSPSRRPAPVGLR